MTLASSGDGSDVTLDRRAIDGFREASPDGSPDFVHALIDQYLREAAAQVVVMTGAAKRLDRLCVKATAHSLKGSSLVMGALRLASLCAGLEDLVVQHADAVVTPEMTDAIDRELACVRDAFAAEEHS